MTQADLPSPGLRERKRRQTRDRISSVALELFLKHGYDGTTIGMIADKADVSPRTIFHYYESKERILEALAGGGEAVFRETLSRASKHASLMETVRDIVTNVVTAYEAEKATAVSKLLYSTERLLAFKQAAYHRKERDLFEALREHWPKDEDEFAVRMAAMAGIGALRISSEFWVKDGRRLPIENYLEAAFEFLADQDDTGPQTSHDRLHRRSGKSLQAYIIAAE